MMKLVVPLLAVVTLFAVGFVLVELRAPLSPSSPSPPSSPRVNEPANAAPAPERPPVVAAPSPPPVTTPAPAPVAAEPPAPPPPAEPVAPPADPLDVVVRGKTRREWHAYYAERQQQIVAEIARYQSIVDRAIAGEEPDPRELGDAHVQIRELNARLKEDLEALQSIDANP